MSERNWDEMGLWDFQYVVKQTGEWRVSKCFETGWNNFSEKLMLILTEVAEVLEAEDTMKNLNVNPFNMDDSDLGSLARLEMAAKNYVEEWIDVMVRIFDLADACNLVLREVPRYGHAAGNVCSKVPLEDQVSRSLRKIVTFISQAMELFRDVDLVVDSDGVIVPSPSCDGDVLVRIAERLSCSAIVAAESILDVGACWEVCYAEKMIKNEGRDKMHGRVR